MKRDIIKQAEKGRRILSTGRDITTSEIETLWNMALQGSNGLWKALTTAFALGVYQGYTQRKNEEKK